MLNYYGRVNCSFSVYLLGYKRNKHKIEENLKWRKPDIHLVKEGHTNTHTHAIRHCIPSEP
jgi:hypothetical protein